jgi:RNA polymerase sigma factor (sigma-70 family)
MTTATGAVDNEQIYREHATELTRYATGLVGPFDTTDVVTDACLRAFQSRNWPTVTNRRAYLYRAVLSVAEDYHRSTLACRLREVKAAGSSIAMPGKVDVNVLKALNQLSVQQRAAVLLTYWEDLSAEAAAERMGVSVGSVKRHLARAHKRLEERLS